MAKKILIIEDEVHVSSYLENLLQDHGYETVAASDAESGYDLLAEHNPDLITLDLQMPNEHGTRFYQKIRNNEDFKGVPIVVITGQPSPHRAIRPAKVAAIVNKPFEPEQLIEVVKQAIGNP